MFSQLLRLHQDRIPPSTSLKFDKWKKYLVGSPGGESDYNNIRYGYELNIDQDLLKTSKLSKFTAIWTETVDDLKAVLDDFIDQCIDGNISAVDSNYDYKFGIPCFVVNRKGAKKRIIKNGSYSSKCYNSLNDIIIPELCKMPSLPHIKEYAQLLHDKNYFALRDLKGAFRQIIIREKDRKYLAYRICGLLFIDNKLPFGISSAPAICQNFVMLIVWILNDKILPDHLLNKILVHIDDFIFAASSIEEVKLMESEFDKLANELGVIVSKSKSVSATDIAIVHGLEWDLSKKTVSIPKEKREELLDLIRAVIDLRWISVRALEKLCGKLMHWSQLRKPGKAFLHNMVYFIYENIREVSISKKAPLHLPAKVIRDLSFWYSYIGFLGKISIESLLSEPSITTSAATDASDVGGGIYWNNHWIAFHFDPLHQH